MLNSDTVEVKQCSSETPIVFTASLQWLMTMLLEFNDHSSAFPLVNITGRNGANHLSLWYSIINYTESQKCKPPKFSNIFFDRNCLLIMIFCMGDNKTCISLLDRSAKSFIHFID